MASVENKKVRQISEGEMLPSIGVVIPVFEKKSKLSHPRVWFRNRKDSIARQSIVPNLCPYCQHALIDWFKTLPNDDDFWYRDRHYPHHSDKSGLQLAVDVRGCRICWIFLSAQAFYSEKPLSAENEVGLTISGCGNGDTSWRLNHMSNDPMNPGMRELSIFCLKIADPAPSRYFGKPTVFERQIVLRDTQKATNGLSSDYTAPLLSAKAWLTECSSLHIECVGLAHYPNPTRLLYIKPDSLRLCSDLAIPLNVSYATLSHCWGLLEFFKLKRDNLSAVQKKIDIQELPKTFQDAIFIARELGFDYLWIDSLCIIQDDANDWRNESSLMCSVYSNAGLNIAAAGAADGSQGCILERPPSQFWTYPVHLVVGDKERKFQFADIGTYDRCVQSQPLAKRAWAVQERLLARRTLHFSKTEVFWECKNKLACESFPNKLPRFLSSGSKFNKTEKLYWEKILRYYTAANLTYGSDKLVALSGIAKKFQQITKDQYLAGMWRSGLESTLCWHVVVNAPFGLDRPAEERAPSWSWASVDGEIFIPSRDSYGNLHVKVINVSVDLKGDDCFGQIHGGLLELECEVILWGMIGLNKDTQVPGEHPVAIGKSIVGLKFYWDSRQYVSTGLHFFLIPVESVTDSREIHGIVVQPTGNRQGQYRRVGVFHTGSERHGQGRADLEREMRSFSIAGGTLATDFVEIVSDENGRKRYIVEII